jgi:hypothetical protein
VTILGRDRGVQSIDVKTKRESDRDELALIASHSEPTPDEAQPCIAATPPLLIKAVFKKDMYTETLWLSTNL